MRLALRFVVPAATVAAAFALFGAEKDAHAQYYVVRRAPASVGLNLGLDAEGAADVTPPQNASTIGGGGFKIRIGAEIRRPFLRFIPEGGFSYDHLFYSDNNGNSQGWNMERAFVGGRIGFGQVIVPIVYAHVGYGWRVTSDPTVPQEGGLTLDVGGALDFRIVPHLMLGLHLEYATLDDSSYGVQWVAAGGHATLLF